MQENTKEVVLTYETLYELLRKEKARPELSKQDENFLHDALNYLREKQKAYDDNLAKNDIFSQSERDKLHIQITNIRKILRDLYDLRERKILTMAVNHSRTGAYIPDTTNLQPSETDMFNSICSILKQYRTGVLHRIVELREPNVMPTILSIPAKKETSQKEQNTQTDENNQKTIRFLDTVDQFVGEELETYGPYSPNDIAKLPNTLANILIEQGKAVENPAQQ